ncbi:MAG: hypothetical protein CVU79_02200 [Elusimicrobia bacterium HGW-Elusimicrobia-3]|jgi:hypothetical protein|nr:MAG: hypothetical protein CVU79_02200 [Elusimicrobia bacterium HGW-Elusimicrobia-3]
MASKISVLLYSHNRAEQFRANLELVLAQSYPAEDFEVLAMDDASGDGTWAMLTAIAASGERGNLRILRNSSNLDIGGCRAELYRNISPESSLVLLMDDDVALPPDFLSWAAAYMAANPGVGALGPRVVYHKDPSRPAHYPNFVSPVTGFYSSRGADAATDCDWLIACCVCFRREALAQAGGFDASFVSSHEEVDLCLKIKAAGYRVVYDPERTVTHDIAEKKRKSDRLYYLYRNKFLVIRKNFRLPWNITATLAILFLGFPRYIADSLVQNRGVNAAELRTIVKAVFDGLRGRGGKL